MDKVKLPKEVAEIIEDFRKAKISDGDIVRMSMRIFEGCSKERSALKEYSDSNLDDLINALKFGYEVEMTPEEKALDYYEGLERLMNESAAKDKRGEALAFANKRAGARNILIMLGIEIKGITD